MPRPSHSTAARSGYFFEPDLSAINSSGARNEQRHTAANTPYLPERYPVTLTYPGPRAGCLALTQRAHGHGCYEYDEDPGFSHDRDVLRHVSHGFTKPKPDFHPHHQYSEADPLGPSRRGRLYHRPSSYDAADGELEFDRHGRSRHYSLPRYESANDESCFDDDVHGGYRRYQSPFQSPSLLSLFGANVGPPSPDSRSQDRENCDTNLDRSGRSRSLGRGSMEPRLDNYPDYPSFEPRKDHGRGRMEPRLDNYPDYPGFLPPEDHDSRRARVRPGGRHLIRHRFEDDSEADDLEDNLSEAFIHRPRLANPRGHHSDSDVGSIDTDSEEEYFRQIRDFEFVDDDIADRYTGRLRAPTAAEKTHRRFLIKLNEELNTEKFRADQSQAELRRQKRHDTHVAQSDTKDDSIPERVARQVRNKYSPAIRRAAADFITGNRKPSPRGRRDNQRSDSESITPQPQNTHPQVRQMATAHLTSSNRNPSPHKTHNNPPQPRRAQDHQTLQQEIHSNSSVALPKDHAPPSYDSVNPAQVTDSLQPEPANHTPRSPVATAATETTTPNTPKASPRSHARNHAIQKTNNRHTSRSAAGATTVITAHPQRLVRNPPFDNWHTSPAELGTNDHSDSSDSGAATPMTSSDDDDNGDRLESAGDGLWDFIDFTLR